MGTRRMMTITIPQSVYDRLQSAWKRTGMDFSFGRWLYSEMFQEIPVTCDMQQRLNDRMAALKMSREEPQVSIDTASFECIGPDLENWLVASKRKEMTTVLCLAALDRLERNVPDAWPPS